MAQWNYGVLKIFYYIDFQWFTKYYRVCFVDKKKYIIFAKNKDYDF